MPHKQIDSLQEHLSQEDRDCYTQDVDTGEQHNEQQDQCIDNTHNSDSEEPEPNDDT